LLSAGVEEREAHREWITATFCHNYSPILHGKKKKSHTNHNVGLFSPQNHELFSIVEKYK